MDITELPDEVLEKEIAEIEAERRKLRVRQVELAAERDRRANEKELAALAKKLGPEKMAQLAKLHQTIEAAAISAAGTAPDPG